MDLLERNKQIVDSFLAGKTNKELSIFYGVGVKQINKILRDNNISLANLRQQQREDIVEEFKSGLDVKTLATKYSMTPAGIWLVLRDFGIRCSNKELLLQNQIQNTQKTSRTAHKVDYLKFNPAKLVESSAELFYWLGFMQADGSLTTQGKIGIQLSIGLSVLDKDHLLKFITWLGFPETRLHHVECKTGDQVRFSFSAPQLFAWSIYGLVPRKTYNYIEPNIPNEYFGDYLRGLIDGDGHIKVESGKTHIEIISNSDYSKWLVNQLKNRNISAKEITYEDKIYSRVRIYGLSEVRKVEALCKSQSTDLKLSRKWDKLANIEINRERCVKHELESRNAAIIADYKAGLSRNELMVKYNRSRPVICQILKDIYQNDIQQRNTRIHELRQHGLTLQQIADQYGITKQGVRVILNSATV